MIRPNVIHIYTIDLLVCSCLPVYVLDRVAAPIDER